MQIFLSRRWLLTVVLTSMAAFAQVDAAPDTREPTIESAADAGFIGVLAVDAGLAEPEPSPVPSFFERLPLTLGVFGNVDGQLSSGDVPGFSCFSGAPRSVLCAGAAARV